MFYLGVDVSKAKLDCLLLDSATGKVKSKSIQNTNAGFKQLIEWLAEKKAPNAHVIMEPTGVYHEPAALALTDVSHCHWSTQPNCVGLPRDLASKTKLIKPTAVCWRATAKL